MTERKEQCLACATSPAGYAVRFAGAVNGARLNEWLQGDLHTPVRRLDEHTVWAAEADVAALLDYFAAHMDAAQISAWPVDEDCSDLPAAGWLSLEDLRRRQEAHWIDDVIDRSRVRTVYQPIVSVQNGEAQVCGYEFLSRALDANDGLIPPYKMFDAARTRGRLFALDRVCRMQAVRHADRVGDNLVFVNFIPTAIYTPEHCLQSTLAAARETGVDPSRIVFEVVETEEVQSLDHLENILQYYRRHGFRYALDDVGQGFSTLENVQRLKPDFVKLDMHYVQGVADDAEKQRVARLFLQTAREVGATPLAEGVEREEDWLWLVEQGFELFQGYLFGKPDPVPASVSMKLPLPS